MDRVFYEIDPFNRLIVGKPPGRGSMVKKFRKVVHGRFGTDENNELFYEVNKSSGIDIPQKIKFSGKYSLDKDRNLVITLNKWNNQCEGNRLTLKTKIIDANNNEIALSVNSKVSENKSLTYIMKLYGSWQADKHNRLTFGVERGRDAIDDLVLSGAWELNRNNEIIYRHGKDAYAVFDIGIGVSNARKLRRKVIFSGRWKMGKARELILETSDIETGGATLRFTKEIFDRSGAAYIESVFREKERFIGGGVAFKW